MGKKIISEKEAELYNTFVYSEFSQNGAISRNYKLWDHYYKDDSRDKLYNTVKKPS